MKDINIGMRSNKMSRNILEGDLETGWAASLQSNQSILKPFRQGDYISMANKSKANQSKYKERKEMDRLFDGLECIEGRCIPQ